MPKNFLVLKTDAANGLFEGQTVSPYYQDENEIIFPATQGMDHHVRIGGEYFSEHLRPC